MHNCSDSRQSNKRSYDPDSGYKKKKKKVEKIYLQSKILSRLLKSMNEFLFTIYVIETIDFLGPPNNQFRTFP